MLENKNNKQCTRRNTVTNLSSMNENKVPEECSNSPLPLSASQPSAAMLESAALTSFQCDKTAENKNLKINQSFSELGV